MEINEFKESFEEFLRTRKKEIAEVINRGESSLLIDFHTLDKFNSNAADFLIERGEDALKNANEVLREMHPEHELTVRFFKLSDTVRIRDLRSKHIGKLVMVEGLIKRASEVRPEIVSAVFECNACKKRVEAEQGSSNIKAPYQCECGSRMFNLVEKKMVDVQVVTIEESPEKMEGGEQPNKISSYLRGALVDPKFQKRVIPGNKVQLTGVLKDIPKKGSNKRYDIYLESSFLDPIEREFEEIEITPKEEKRILELSKEPKILDKIVQSIVPSIYGLNEVKKAIALQLFSGVRKNRPDGTVTRGDMHVLLIGEPGTGKSVILKFVGELAPKGRYVVGKSATAAGITAAVVRDEMLEGFALEAGALVLANGGICGVDEIDKMTSEDRSAMHECMEQQTITISKANIQATLQTRTAILAAGNPKFGRFDPYRPIAEQINISETLLSRFDLIFPIKDIPDKERDYKMADHILSLHMKPEEQRGLLDLDLLRKYIAYAKRNVSPKISREAEDELKKFYVKIRMKGLNRPEGVTVTISARQLEALIRLSEASAKARLSDIVEKEDARRAIEMLTYSLKQVGVDPETGEFDIDRIESGITSTQRNRIRTIIDIVTTLSKELGSAVPIEDIIAEAENRGLTDSEAEEILKRLKREGEIFEPKYGHVQKI